MTKFLKFNLYTFEVSIKLSHLILMQRMYNTSSNSSSRQIENEHFIPDTVIRSDLFRRVSPTFNENLPERCSEEGIIYNNHNTLFANSFPLTIQQYSWPYYNLNHQQYPIFFGTPLYHNNVSRTLHSQQGNRSYGTYHKSIDMDVMSFRSWEKIAEKPSTNPGFIFTLMSYNVLAQDLIEQHSYLYNSHNSASLDWSIRWNNLLKEITNFQPDILCLQEVQESHINNYYSTLHSLGFRGIFKKRTGGQSDGCAIYYKTDIVDLVEHNLIEYFQPKVSVLNRDNVGIVAKFVPKMHPTREFIVATTHLLYNPKRSDVRLAQMQLLLTDIERMSYKYNGENSHYLPIIITGDLNSPPYSDLYKYITRGRINYKNLSPGLLETPINTKKQILVTSNLGITDNSQYLEVVQKRSTEKVIINLENNLDDVRKKSVTTANRQKYDDKSFTLNNEDCLQDKSLSHSFGLKSVYNHGTVNNTEGTTFQDEWLTVDYIFYSVNKVSNYEEDKLKLLSRFRLPTSKELKNFKIPNKFLGSDHLSLLARFKLEF